MTNNRFYNFIVILTLMLTAALGVQAETLLDGKKWTSISLNTNKPSSGYSSGNMQGAAIYNGNMYQFRNGGGDNKNNVTYDIYNISTGVWTTGGTLACVGNAHAGSGCFGTKVFTTSNSTYDQDCTIPFLYLTNHNTIQIVDIEHDVLVATWTLPKLDDDAIAAYDFANGKLWSIGYVSGSRKAPYLVRTKTGLDFTTVPTDQTIIFTDDEKTSVGGPDDDDIQRTLINGTIQDAQYVNGKIYFCAGGGSSAHRTEHCRIHVYDTTGKTIVDTRMCADTNEAEGFVYDANSNTFLMTIMGTNFWKLSAGTGYDGYNFQPATLIDDYYEISNASQLLWFKQQVYGGRTDIKARLTADINMSGVTDPFSNYVYDYNIALAGKTTAQYPATFAFRGEFDGDGHTIRNYSITSTPYYYNGLFPYCIDADIHDLTVRGSITLTQCDAMVQQSDDSWKAVSKQPVAYVGLVGYMIGGTLTNVNSYLSIDETVAGVNGTINKLVGGTGTTTPTTTNCSTEDPSLKTHAQNDGKHYYENGFCVCTDCSKNTTGYYEEPVEVTEENYAALGLTNAYVGYYAVQNAGNMFWISKNFSSSNYNRNYVMTADIDMAGDDANHKDWTGIGEYNSNTKTSHYCGTFDGNGHKFTNFYMKVSASWKAMFNLTNEGAVIKNFTISGQMNISGGGQIGVVIGRVQGTTKLEDIHSSVNLTVTSGTISAIGGIIGQASGQTNLNRCRYSGTITGNSSYNGLGGIIGNGENPITINNCLFDGTIITTSTQARTGVDNGIKIGGLCSRNNNTTKITNSMSRGTISVPETADKGNVGIILGTQTQDRTLTITNTYYKAISGMNAVGNNSCSTKTSANPTAITNESPISLRVALGQANWKLETGDGAKEYPIPGTGGPIWSVVTITFNTNGGSAVTPISGIEGTSVTAPANPVKEGHDFAGWVDAQGNATTVPTVMPSANLTIYASWNIKQYTITFDTDGGSTIAPITQDYGTSITAPANPSKEDWDFNGWTPALPSTMPANDLIVKALWVQETYNNGFNVNTSCAANVKYQMPKGSGTAEAPYLIDNGGKLWWFANQVKTDKTLCAKLTADINTECNIRTTNASTNLPQMGAWGAPYTGFFDGQGYRIYNWKQIWSDSRAGMFGYTTNATIKDFTLEGTMTVSGSGQQIAPVVGYTGAGTLVEDIWSKVDIAANGTVFCVGGVVGRQNGTVNRCRYSGAITCAAGVYNGIGGVIGETYGGTTSNCLFDGTITAPSTDANLRVGGIVGYQTESTASTVKNCLVNGTITVTNYSTATSGIVFGGIAAVNVRINASNIYYTNNNVSASLNRAAGISNRAAMGHCENVTGKAIITNGTLRDLLGNGNWKQDATAGYPVPCKGTATTGLDANGFSYARDGQHDAVTLNGEWYEIANGGQLLDYAEKVAAGTIALSSKARLTADIDLEWCDFPGIGVYTDGTNTKKFQGTFDGQGHTIRGMYRQVQGAAQRKGMFNLVENTTIKDFTVEGEIQVHEGSNTTFFIGGVVGIGDTGVTLEDVTSSVDINVINCGATTRIIGGVAGRIKGTMNRCRYNGTMDLGTNTAQEIGGVLASANITTMSNCLFDGKIVAATTSTTASQVVIGGLLGIDYDAVTMKNCLSNGTITLTNSPITDCVGAVWGQIKKASTSTVTYYTTTGITKAGAALDQAGGASTSSNMSTTAVGETSWDDVTLALNNNSTLAGNWQVVDGLAYPIPSYFSHDHSYDAYGFCTSCKNPEPIGDPDAEGYYHIDHLGDLMQFAALVNKSPNGTIINAKVTEDIDLTNYPHILTTTIGDKDHHYCGTFDGQGHTLKEVNVESNQRYVGLFACVGITNTDSTKVVHGVVKNFSVSGTVKATYYSSWGGNTPLIMGVIGEVYDGTIENVHSTVNFTCTSGTRSHIGGVVGGSLKGSGDAGEVNIKDCTYDGTLTLNAVDCIGGIVGYAQHHTNIYDCLYAGTINQNYTGPSQTDDTQQTYSYIGGILGYTNSGTNGVQNCLVLGNLSTNLTAETTVMKKEGVNVNICVGLDGNINNSYKNYYGNFISQTVRKNYHQLPSTLFSGTARICNDADFANGAVCAELNENKNFDNHWGQILGYQTGSNKDPNSPAQVYPYPGYTDPAQTIYKVVRTKNAVDNTKYDYVADYYFFDDFGDSTHLPSKAASLKVKKIEYTRQAKYMTGYISMCLPFAFESSMLNENAKCYQYESAVGSTVRFTEITEFPIAAGTPFIMYDKSGTDWKPTFDEAKETEITVTANNPEDDGAGLYGTFDTKKPGAWSESNLLYKLHSNGTKFVRTTANSDVYPFRVWLKLPTSNNAREHYPVFVDEVITTSIPDVELQFNDADGTSHIYNLNGQRTGTDAHGILIINGRKVIR